MLNCVFDAFGFRLGSRKLFRGAGRLNAMRFLVALLLGLALVLPWSPPAAALSCAYPLYDTPQELLRHRLHAWGEDHEQAYEVLVVGQVVSTSETFGEDWNDFEISRIAAAGVFGGVVDSASIEMLTSRLGMWSGDPNPTPIWGDRSSPFFAIPLHINDEGQFAGGGPCAMWSEVDDVEALLDELVGIAGEVSVEYVLFDPPAQNAVWEMPPPVPPTSGEPADSPTTTLFGGGDLPPPVDGRPRVATPLASTSSSMVVARVALITLAGAGVIAVWRSRSRNSAQAATATDDDHLTGDVGRF